MNHRYCFTLLLFLPLLLAGQSKPNLIALRTEASIRIDGILDEAAWEAAETTTDFTTLRPVPGKPASQPTHVKVIYDNRGIYFGARMVDSAPDSILAELTERDGLGNTDFFGFVLDPYQSGIDGFTFIVTPANVQFDAKQNAGNEDENWDAVWQSSTTRDAEGWVAEMFLPYSALRFPSTAEQTWTINFVRMIRRLNEQSFWAEIDPNVDGFLNQSGTLSGLYDIEAPARIQATPFLAVYGLRGHDIGEPATNGTSVTGGMDVKVGLSDAFTLDMTLIPDFGEARSDDQILNLGPFEQRFDEQRAFFTEGTELFNKGGLFYSRRIGGRNYFGSALDNQMVEGETVVSNPQRAKLYNATKISGRTANGTGIGFFNAIEQENYAVVRNSEGEERRILTNPLTNYNVMVVDQNLKNNSSVTLVNTNVIREGEATDANVTGLLWDVHNNANKYSVSGQLSLSQRFLPKETSTGHTGVLSLNRISGNWTWRLIYGEESDTYNTNDLGILFANNKRFGRGVVQFNRPKPFFNGYFLRAGGGADLEYNALYKPGNFTSVGTEAWLYVQTKHFWNFDLWFDSELSDSYDYFEPRVEGRFLRNPGENGFGGWAGSDNRKAIRVSGNFNWNNYYGADRMDLYLNANIRWRVSDRMSYSAFAFRGRERNEVGFVNTDTYTTSGGEEITEVFMGRRNVTSVEAGLSGKYSFSANMTLNLRLRHYWSGVAYQEFNLLGSDGRLLPTDYEQNHNQDFDAFNLDLIYRWRFAPGSDLFVVYKSNITDFDEQRAGGYGESFNGLWKNTPRQSSVSVKMVYWLDYASLFR